MKHNQSPKKRSNQLLHLIFGFTVALVLMCIGALLMQEMTLFFAFSGISVILLIWAYLVVRKEGKVISQFHRSFIRRSTVPNSDMYDRFSLPVIVLCEDEIVWYNSLFRSFVLKSEDVVGAIPERLLSLATRSSLRLSGKGEEEIDGKCYSIYSSYYEDDQKRYQVLYYADISDWKAIATAYDESRPVVAILAIDSFDEIVDSMSESEQAGFKGAIDKEIEKFTASISGVTKKLKNNRYISIFDEKSYAALRADGFSILKQVRNLEFPGKVKATLSIGVGRGADTMKHCEQIALQSLEMAQGRGGDQAAIKTKDNYEFFGGVSGSGVEKRTKVKTRVVASALKELIRGSDRIFIMGHKFGDIDSLGASYALWKSIVSQGREAYIVLDEKTHLAKSLIAQIRQDESQAVLISGSQAKAGLTRKSLLIICDTHRRDFIEDSSIYDGCQFTVVIDHHRKNTDFIDDSVLFYHEPHASSTCEMVAELLQYMDSSSIEPAQANALLAGIMLDTRNFVLRTGVRTFEASAYLRERGADPVAVKKLFADSIDVYRERSMLVSRAQFYQQFALTSPDDGQQVSRVAASQAADELLNIEGVDASFVLYSYGDNVSISARSLGKVNVQIIMEQLGGGGHHTMAATQLKGVSLNEAKSRLIQILEQSHRKDDSK